MGDIPRCDKCGRTFDKKRQHYREFHDKTVRTAMIDHDGNMVMALRSAEGFTCSQCPVAFPCNEYRKMYKHRCRIRTEVLSSQDAPPSLTPQTDLARPSPPPLSSPEPSPFVSSSGLLVDEPLDTLLLGIDPKHRVLVCRQHHVVIIPTVKAICRHYTSHHHGSRVVMGHTDALVDILNYHNVQPDFKGPREAVDPIACIRVPIDGYHCPGCSFACKTAKVAKAHSSRLAHPTPEGGFVQKLKHSYWKVNRLVTATPPTTDLSTSAQSKLTELTNELFAPSPSRPAGSAGDR